MFKSQSNRLKFMYRMNKNSAVVEMGDRATAKWAEKCGGAVPLAVGELGPHLTRYPLGRGLPPYQVAS